CLSPGSFAQADTTADAPTVTVQATAELASSVLARVSEGTGIVVACDPFVARRRITVDIKDAAFMDALETLSIAAVATWDSAYLCVPADGESGPDVTPPGWVRPPQTVLSLSGGTGACAKILETLTSKCAAPIGHLPGAGKVQITTAKCDGATLEEVLTGITGDNFTWTRGFWLAPIDRAAVFGRYANLPMEQREERVLRHTDQMLMLNKDDVRQALSARHRELSALPESVRLAHIDVYAEQIRAGITVLNTLSSDVRDRARDGMKIFFDMGLDVYRDLTEDEQIETTPIMEAMGELVR
ncbi:MAG TPA: hypothetical protein QGH10_20480, partial [Armatimonadota bacterium]|nr:hypothetical protein [Armatimonadota bacterium]